MITSVALCLKPGGSYASTASAKGRPPGEVFIEAVDGLMFRCPARPGPGASPRRSAGERTCTSLSDNRPPRDRFAFPTASTCRL